MFENAESASGMMALPRLNLALGLSFLENHLMPKPFDVLAFLSSAAMMSRKAESYHMNFPE